MVESFALVKSQSVCVHDMTSVGSGGGSAFDLGYLSNINDRLIRIVGRTCGHHTSGIHMESSYWAASHYVGCHTHWHDKYFTGEVNRTRIYQWHDNYTAGWEWWWRHDDQRSETSYRIDTHRGYATYTEQHLPGPLLGMKGRSGGIFDNLQPRVNLCYCPRVSLTFTQMADINTEMGITACSGYSLYHSMNGYYSGGNQCTHVPTEDGGDTYISGDSICAHTTDPDHILQTYTILLQVRLNHGGTSYYHGGAFVERRMNVWFRPRCVYSDIYQVTGVTDMTILLQESDTQTINWSHYYIDKYPANTCLQSFSTPNGSPRVSVSGTTITLAVSEPTWAGTHHIYIHGWHSTSPDSSTPGNTVDHWFYVTITPICVVSTIQQPYAIGNYWIWDMESTNWDISPYTHYYRNSWSGYDPCVIGYEILADDGTTSGTPVTSISGRTLTLAVNNPELVGEWYPIIRAWYTTFTDRTAPTNEHRQQLTLTVVPQCVTSAIIQPVPLLTMSTPLNGYIYQDVSPYYHTYRDTWNERWYDPCVISYRQDASAGTFWHVTNATDSYVMLYTYDTAEIGTHTPNFIAYYSDWSDRSTPSSIYHEQFVEVTIEPRCVITSYLPTTLIDPDIRYQIGADGRLELPFAFTFEPADCNYYQIYTAMVNNGDVPAWMTVDQENTMIVIDTSNGAYAGVYTVLLSAKINHIPLVATEEEIEFTVLMTSDGCVNTLFIDQAIGDMEFEIDYGQAYTVQTMPDWLDTVTEEGSFDCGARRYTLYGDATTTFVQNGYGSAHEFRTITTAPAKMGSYTMSFYIELANYDDLNPIIRIKKQFTVTITGACTDTVFAYVQIPLQVHQVTRSATQYTHPEYQDSVSAAANYGGGYTYCGTRVWTFDDWTSEDFTTAPSVMTYVDASRRFDLYGDNSGQYGIYGATFSVTLADYPDFAAQSFAFAAEVVPNCLGAVITVASIEDMQTPMNSIIKQPFAAYTHNEQGTYDGYCGDIEYVLGGDTHTDFLNLVHDTEADTRELTLATIHNYIGNHSVYVRGRLALFTAVYLDVAFAADVTSPCAIADFDPSDILASPLVHHIGEDAAQQYAFTFPYSPCSPQYKPAYSLAVEGYADLPAWVYVDDYDPTNPQLILDTANPGDVGDFMLTISAVMNTYPATRDASADIELQVFLVVEACFKTYFTSDHAFEDMTYTMGNDASLQDFPPFLDFVTVDTGGATDCGLRKYTVSSSRGATQLVSVDRDLNQVVVQSSDYLDLGGHVITLTVELEDFPDLTPYIIVTKSFNIFVDSICDTTYFIDPKQYAMQYQIAQPAAFQPFTGWKDKMSIGNGVYDGYTYCGPRDYAISSLSPANSAISLDTDAGHFAVFSAEKDDVATVTVDVSASLLQFPGAVTGTFSFMVYIVDLCENYRLVQTKETQAGMSNLDYTVGDPEKAQVSPSYNFDIDVTMWALNFNTAAGAASICGDVTQSLRRQDGKTVPSFLGFSYSAMSNVGVFSVSTASASDAGEYELQIYYEGTALGPSGPNAATDFTLTITELASTNSNELPYLDPRPDDIYQIDVGDEFAWTFTYRDPENDAVTVSVSLQNPKLAGCRCSDLDEADGIYTWEFIATEEMAGETVQVVIKLEDPLSTATRSFQVDVLVPVVLEGAEEVDASAVKLAEAVEAIDDIMGGVLADVDLTADTNADTITFDGEVDEEKQGGQPQLQQLSRAELEVVQAESEEKLAEILGEPGGAGELLAAGKVLTAEQEKEIAETIPAPVPLPRHIDATGGMDLGFSRPIAVPPPGEKQKLVQLIMDNSMVECSLKSQETGQRVMGKPMFDADKFNPDTGRRLSEVDNPKAQRQLTNLINKLETVTPRRKLGDMDDDDKRGFSWTILSYEESGIRFDFIYNDPAYVSTEGQDEIEVGFSNADKFLIGQDGLSVPADFSMIVKVPKQMDGEQFALITTVAFTNSVFVRVAIVGTFLIILIQSGAIVRLWSALLTLQMIIHIANFSIEFPPNVSFLLRYLKNSIYFEGIGYTIGLQNFLDITPTIPFSDAFDVQGYRERSLVKNMGLLCTFFVLIAFQVLFLFLFSVFQSCCQDIKSLRRMQRILRSIIAPQIMYYMLFAFLEVLVCLGITFIPTETTSLMTLLEWRSGDAIQFFLCCMLGFACGVFLLFQLVFACYKSRLLSNIAEVVPGENKLAGGVTILLKAYRNARKIRKDEREIKIKRRHGHPQFGDYEETPAKIRQDEVHGGSEYTPAFRKGKGSSEDGFLHEGGDVELTDQTSSVGAPSSQFDSQLISEQESILNDGESQFSSGVYSTASKRSKRSRRSRHSRTRSDSSDQITLNSDYTNYTARSNISIPVDDVFDFQPAQKESQILPQRHRDPESAKQAAKEAKRQEFLDIFHRVIDLGKRECYDQSVEIRMQYLEDMLQKNEKHHKKIVEWVQDYTWELVLCKDMRMYDRAALSFHLIFLLRRMLFVAGLFLLNSNGTVQICAFMFLSLLSITYIGWVQPYKNQNTNRLEVFNEETIFLAGFLVLLMNAGQGYLEKEGISRIGWGFIALITANMFINTFAIIGQIVDDWKNSPVMRKRRAKFRHFRRKLRHWDQDKCSCKCPSCSGNYRRANQIPRAPSKFKIELKLCGFDDLIHEAPKKAFKFQLHGDKSIGYNPADRALTRKFRSKMAAIREEDEDGYDDYAEELPQNVTESSDSSEESSSSEEETAPKRPTKQDRYRKWYPKTLDTYDEYYKSGDMEEKNSKTERYKEWQVKDMAAGGQELDDSESDEDGIVAGIAQFEARKRAEMKKFVKGLGEHNENVMYHLNTINEDNESEEEEEKEKYQRRTLRGLGAITNILATIKQQPKKGTFDSDSDQDEYSDGEQDQQDKQTEKRNAVVQPLVKRQAPTKRVNNQNQRSIGNSVQSSHQQSSSTSELTQLTTDKASRQEQIQREISQLDISSESDPDNSAMPSYGLYGSQAERNSQSTAN